MNQIQLKAAMLLLLTLCLVSLVSYTNANFGVKFDGTEYLDWDYGNTGMDIPAGDFTLWIWSKHDTATFSTSEWQTTYQMGEYNGTKWVDYICLMYFKDGSGNMSFYFYLYDEFASTADADSLTFFFNSSTGTVRIADNTWELLMISYDVGNVPKMYVYKENGTSMNSDDGTDLYAQVSVAPTWSKITGPWVQSDNNSIDGSRLGMQRGGSSPSEGAFGPFGVISGKALTYEAGKELWYKQYLQWSAQRGFMYPLHEGQGTYGSEVFGILGGTFSGGTWSADGPHLIGGR